MAQVDIPVPESLREALSAPICLDLSLPKPQKLTVNLPSGAALTSLSNIGQNIPNDCSLTFSLMLQIMPMMASMECVLKILKLLKPLSDAVTSPPPTPKLIWDIVVAVADLAPCFLMLTPAGMIPFVRDILCLILKVLNCLIGQLKTIGNLLGGLAITLEDARGSNNDELAATIECAQQNAITAMGHLMEGLGPVQTIMDLASPFMSIAGVAEIKLPAIGSASDVESLNRVIRQLDEVVRTIQQIVDGLGRVSVVSSADFLGRGWRFPILPDASGSLGYSEGGEHIEHSLTLILMTTFGERAMRPDFGCEAPDLVFAPGSVQYLRLLESSVRKAVRDFEPRVELEFATAEVDPEEQNRVTVRIGYKVRGANSRGNLVFPFYLGSDGGPA